MSHSTVISYSRYLCIKGGRSLHVIYSSRSPCLIGTEYVIEGLIGGRTLYHSRSHCLIGGRTLISFSRSQCLIGCRPQCTVGQRASMSDFLLRRQQHGPKVHNATVSVRIIGHRSEPPVCLTLSSYPYSGLL